MRATLWTALVPLGSRQTINHCNSIHFIPQSNRNALSLMLGDLTARACSLPLGTARPRASAAPTGRRISASEAQARRKQIRLRTRPRQPQLSTKCSPVAVLAYGRLVHLVLHWNTTLLPLGPARRPRGRTSRGTWNPSGNAKGTRWQCTR